MAAVDTTDQAWIDLLADVAALKATVNTADTGLEDKVAALEATIDTENTGLKDRVEALEDEAEVVDETALSARVLALEKKQIDADVPQEGSSKFTGAAATLVPAGGGDPAHHFAAGGKFYLFNSVAVTTEDGTKVTALAAQADATIKAWLVSSASGQIKEVV